MLYLFTALADLEGGWGTRRALPLKELFLISYVSMREQLGIQETRTDFSEYICFRCHKQEDLSKRIQTSLNSFKRCKFSVSFQGGVHSKLRFHKHSGSATAQN